MSDNRIRSIVIVGGGAAGWLAAASLARVLKRDYCEIQLVESPQARPGLSSESGSPAWHRLQRLLGTDEADLIRRTQATFKLGIEFCDWGRPKDRYLHAFGPFGARLEAVPFHQYWIKLRQLGDSAGIEEYSAAAAISRSGRFSRPSTDHRSVMSQYSYGFHFDASMLASYLSEYAQARGVTRLAREIVDVQLRADDGFIDGLRLDDGTQVSADLYIDCSGADGLLMNRALKVGYEDWTRWLLCDRAVTTSCAAPDDPPTVSQALARAAGWQWRVPLRNYVDCGYAFASRFLSDDAAAAALLDELPARAMSEPRFLQIATGRPEKFWFRNCLSLGVGALEPLEPTRLALVQTAITRLLTIFPDRRFNPSDAEECNRLTSLEYERIRDFLILHYKATTRADSPFWNYCRDMAIPDSLRNKIELFASSGRLSLFDDEHFGEDSWLAVLLGQNVLPQSYDPLVDALAMERVRSAFSRMSTMIREGVESLPAHRQVLAQYGAPQ